MGDSKIEWTDKVWNPVTGCVKVSAGCAHCYAERQMNRFEPGRKFTDVQLHERRLDYPLQWSKPSMIFVNSQSDLFQDAVPDSFIANVFSVMYHASHHQFQVLTKRPQRALEWFDKVKTDRTVSYHSYDGIIVGGMDWPPPNVWIGVSVEDQKSADERLPIAEKIPAALRFISVEPLIDEIDLMPHLNGDFHWVIVGGESGPKARPAYPRWVRSIRDDCADQGIPFMFKQWGNNEPIIPTQEGVRHSESIPPPIQFKTHRSKKTAGRLLDGVLHDEFPEVANAE